MIVKQSDIDLIYKKISKSIRNKKRIYLFEKNYYSNSKLLIDKINNGYIYHSYNIFMIKDPKKRIIMSEVLEDKLVNHLISYKILSKLDKYLIDSNCATRKNKGSGYARGLLHKYLIKNKSSDFYILKCDIKKYFYNISHNILLEKLTKYLSYEEVNIIKKTLDTTNLEYINNKIDSFNIDIKYRYGYGLSIGLYSNQILAVYFLNEIDHFIKEELGCKYYIRYMDDMVIINKDKEYLRYILDILRIKLKKEYELEFNSKTKIYKSSEGFEFLGIRYKIVNNKIKRRVRNSTRKRVLKNINAINYLKIEK